MITKKYEEKENSIMDNIKEANEKYYIDKMSDYLVKNEKEKKSLISQIENLKTSDMKVGRSEV